MFVELKTSHTHTHTYTKITMLYDRLEREIHLIDYTHTWRR